MLPGNILTAQARSGMALGHTGAVLSKTIAAQQCGAKHTVAYIRLVAMTLYAGSVTHENADVVEHSGLFYCRLIKAKPFPAVDLKRQIGHRTAVGHVNIPKTAAFGIISVNHFLPCHGSVLWIDSVNCLGSL